MKCHHLSFWLTVPFILIIAGCGSRAPSPTAVPVTPTASPTLATTASPSEIATSTTPSPASTPTILPTASLGDLPIPALPDFPGSAGDYRLATPAPDQLLDLMTAARQQLLLMRGVTSTGKWDQEQLQRWDWLSPGVSSDINAFVAAVEGTFLQAYPTSLPDPAIVFQDPYPTWWTAYPEQRPYPPRFVVDAFLSQLNEDRQKLIEGQSIDISSYSGEIYAAELDGTPGQEWIFYLWTPGMDARYNGIAMWQAVDEAPGPTYLAMGDPLLAQPNLWPETYQVIDLTGDGLSDLITLGTGAGAGMVLEDYIAYQWMPPAEFKEMSHIIHWEDMGAEDFADDPFVKFFPETPPALRLVREENHAWDCVYQTVEVYRWTDGREQRVETTTIDPELPSCLLARATQMYASDQIDFDTSLRLLERALAGFDPHTPADLPKIAFARYHLAILETIRGNDNAARLHLRNTNQIFDNDAPTAQYLSETLLPLLAKPQIKASDLCSLGYSAPESVFSAWRSGLHRRFWPVTPQDICAPYDVTMRVMQQLPVGSPDSPESRISDAGFYGGTAQTLQFPGLQEAIWLALINETPGEPWLIASIPTENDIEWVRLAWFHDTVGPPLWLTTDVTGDGAADVALAFAVQEMRDCNAGEDGFEVFIAGRVSAQANVMPVKQSTFVSHPVNPSI